MAICTYSFKAERQVQLSKNFKVREFRCKDGNDKIVVNCDLVDVLQKIREHFGKPVVITSAYRTESYNKKVGGSPNSQHLYGNAADITIAGLKAKDIAAYVEKLMPNTGGIGIYTTQNFVHVDVRASKSRWTMK